MLTCLGLSLMICKMWLFRPIIGLLRGMCVKGLTQYSTSYTVSIQQILAFLLFLLHLILSFSRDQGHDLNIMVTQVLSSVCSVWLVPILLSCYGRKHNPVDSRKSVPIWLNDVVVWMIDPKFLFLCSRYPYPCHRLMIYRVKLPISWLWNYPHNFSPLGY